MKARPMESTIFSATIHLDPKLRVAVRQLWATAQCMDLHYGSADEYVKVIQQRLGQLQEENETLRAQMKQARRILEIP